MAAVAAGRLGSLVARDAGGWWRPRRSATGHLRISLLEQVLDVTPEELDAALVEARARGHPRRPTTSRRGRLPPRSRSARRPTASSDRVRGGAWHRRWAEVLEDNPGVLPADPAALADRRALAPCPRRTPGGRGRGGRAALSGADRRPAPGDAAVEAGALGVGLARRPGSRHRAQAARSRGPGRRRRPVDRAGELPRGPGRGARAPAGRVGACRARRLPCDHRGGQGRDRSPLPRDDTGPVRQVRPLLRPARPLLAPGAQPRDAPARERRAISHRHGRGCGHRRRARRRHAGAWSTWCCAPTRASSRATPTAPPTTSRTSWPSSATSPATTRCSPTATSCGAGASCGEHRRAQEIGDAALARLRHPELSVGLWEHLVENPAFSLTCTGDWARARRAPRGVGAVVGGRRPHQQRTPRAPRPPPARDRRCRALAGAGRAGDPRRRRTGPGPAHLAAAAHAAAGDLAAARAIYRATVGRPRRCSPPTTTSVLRRDRRSAGRGRRRARRSPGRPDRGRRTAPVRRSPTPRAVPPLRHARRGLAPRPRRPARPLPRPRRPPGAAGGPRGLGTDRARPGRGCHAPVAGGAGGGPRRPRRCPAPPRGRTGARRSSWTPRPCWRAPTRWRRGGRSARANVVRTGC